MKRLFTIALVLGLLLAAGTATAATPGLTALNAKLRAVEAQARQQQKWNARTTSALVAAQQENARLRAELTRHVDVFTCSTALQSDINNAFYNIFALMLGQPEANLRIDDKGACSRIGVTRSALVRAPALSDGGRLARLWIAQHAAGQVPGK